MHREVFETVQVTGPRCDPRKRHALSCPEDALASGSQELNIYVNTSREVHGSREFSMPAWFRERLQPLLFGMYVSDSVKDVKCDKCRGTSRKAN